MTNALSLGQVLVEISLGYGEKLVFGSLIPKTYYNLQLIIYEL